jgi:hypothetical protein
MKEVAVDFGVIVFLIVWLLCKDCTNEVAEFGDMDTERICREFLEIEKDSFKTKFIFTSLGGVFFLESSLDLCGGFACTDAGFMFVGNRFIEESIS